MTQAQIQIMPGAYENPDAIDKVIQYICRLDKPAPFPLYCYGAAPSPDVSAACGNIIQCFYDSRNMQNNPPEQRLWHFVISFALPFQYMKPMYFYFIDAAARLFSNEYADCFSFHTDKAHPHFHFCISSSSYIPGIPSLDTEKMRTYVNQMIELASAYHINLIPVTKEA